MFEINVSKLDILGEGGNGTAYFCKKSNRVIKITSCVYEYMAATQLIGQNCLHLANVYETHILENEKYLILLEKVETNDSLFQYEISVLENILEEYGINLQLLVEDFPIEEVIDVEGQTLFGKGVSEKIIEIIIAAYCAQEEFFDYVGSYSNDLHFGNMGINNHRNIVFFDQSF